MATILYAFLIFTLGAVTGAALVIVPAAVAYLRSRTLPPPPPRRAPGRPRTRKTPAPQSPDILGIDPLTGIPVSTWEDHRRLLAALLAQKKVSVEEAENFLHVPYSEWTPANLKDLKEYYL